MASNSGLKRYPEYKGFNLPEIEKEVLRYWEDHDIFTKSVEQRSKDNQFVFYEGPPSANGLPGIHHVMARTIKDIFCRYKTLKGFRVERKAGWDTHGLPVELGVEKELGITKEDIGKTISVEEYNLACREAVMRYTDIWLELTRKMGYWVDMQDPYVTYDPKYMESVWWLLKEIYNKGLLYKGYTIQPYSPKAGTGLSSHELNQPGTYRDTTDTTVVAQFRAKVDTLPEKLKPYPELHFLAWTTTPWTLPSNTALTVGPKIHYAVVRTFNQYTHKPVTVILANDLVNSVLSGKFSVVHNEDELLYSEGDKHIPYFVAAHIPGSELVGIRYEQLLPYTLPYENPENAFRVIAGDFVTTEDGTGIVHTAPTFGADDAKVAREANPPVPPMLVLDSLNNPVPLVDLQGRFTHHMGEFAGKYVKNEYYDDDEAPEKSVDVEIAIKLKEENKAFKVEKYTHSYPNCWRTDKPILYYPLDSWFIKVTSVRDRMVELNSTINWKPKATGEGRFGNWLQNANDWNLSRSRYWGIPLPIWRTEDGKEEKVIGSVEELVAEIDRSVSAGLMDTNPFIGFVTGDMSKDNYAKVDLHKNIVDRIILTSSNGKPMKRESDLIDVWFDSGSMPYAQWHYPFENKELIDNGTKFPADYIAEGVDQTRGWFYTLHAIATMVFDSVAYKNVISNGLVLDKFGQKMSKRLGNSVDPFITIDATGADVVRWYMLTNAAPWDNLKFNPTGLDESLRKQFGTLYNVYSFFALYANLDEFDRNEEQIPLDERTELDRWILSRLNTLIKGVQEGMEDFDPTKGCRMIQDFTLEHLSNWFVRLSRKRFWKSDDPKDKAAAYQTLYTCLETLSRLMSSFTPFYSDRLYMDLHQGDDAALSVHLSDFPELNESAIDSELESRMDLAQQITSMILAIRKKEMVKVRQPLQKILIPVRSQQTEDRIRKVADVILTEVNVKEIEFLHPDSEIKIIQQLKPDFKILGPRAGKNMKQVAEACKVLSQDEIATIQATGKLEINLGDQGTFDLSLEEVNITSTDMPGWQVMSEGGITVALDMTITPELEAEGLARELVNRVQNLRKSNDFDVTDRIEVYISPAEKLESAVNIYNDYIRAEILASRIVFQTLSEEDERFEINQIPIQIRILKV
ncbi:MAG: isoleucine--tRNA ligase [Bacteroidetes bacterium]|nr:isoleucine--tRNA ligase [Bacteroidota bacterium]